jgi:nitronate monooxygenase
MGADFAYIGSRWLATKESNVSDGYREAIVESTAADIITPTCSPACMAIT